MNATPDRARIIAPPPLLGFACIVLAFVARHFLPLRLSVRANPIQIGIGIFMLVAAVCAIALARRAFIAHGTHPNPYRSTKALVEGGLFGFSRNPIYIAFLVFVLSFTLLANSLWFVIAAFVLFVILHFGIVKREETYLRTKFGSSYEQYCSRVRRWI
jgi:protein-S-isoprenylcysteine O-methyltransferase Ste14